MTPVDGTSGCAAVRAAWPHLISVGVLGMTTVPPSGALAMAAAMPRHAAVGKVCQPAGPWSAKAVQAQSWGRTTRVLSLAVFTWTIPVSGAVVILRDVANSPKRTSKGPPGSFAAPLGFWPRATAMSTLCSGA